MASMSVPLDSCHLAHRVDGDRAVPRSEAHQIRDHELGCTRTAHGRGAFQDDIGRARAAGLGRGRGGSPARGRGRSAHWRCGTGCARSVARRASWHSHLECGVKHDRIDWPDLAGHVVDRLAQEWRDFLDVLPTKELLILKRSGNVAPSGNSYSAPMMTLTACSSRCMLRLMRIMACWSSLHLMTRTLPSPASSVGQVGCR